MRVDDLGRLLQNKQDNGNNLMPLSYNTNANQDIEAQKAQKSASLSDFMEMISMLVSKTMKKKGVVFKPDEGARLQVDQVNKVDNPYIFYEVIDRTPKKELKPREREEIIEVTDDKNGRRQGRIYGQKFECTVQFNFLACDYTSVNTVMNDFEDLIFNYSAYFKKNGVAEILFKRHFTDKNLDIYRQTLSVRSLQYYVEIEKLFAAFETEIEAITVE